MGEPFDARGAGLGGSEPIIDLTTSDTRDRLVRAAAEIFREQGYTGTRVVDIARRAGFTSGALYSHFDSRATLLAEAIVVENDRMLREVADGLAGLDGPPTSEIAGLLTQFLSLQFSQADQLLLDGLAMCPREPEVQERIGAALRRVVEELENRVRATPSRPESFLEEDPAAVSFLLLVFLTGATAVRAAGLQDLVPERLEALLAGLLDHLGAPDPSTVDDGT
jgi:AcrR family transcriptional regulator